MVRKEILWTRKLSRNTLLDKEKKTGKGFQMIQWRLIFAIVIRFSRLRFWVGYFIYFKIKHVFFQWMFFNLIKEINRLRKEINRLLSKGMSNIYLKVTIETFSKPRFYGFKECVIRSVLGSSNSCWYHWILKLLLATKNLTSGSKTVCGFSIF